MEKSKHTKKGKKNWIQGAIKHPGALHRELGIKAGKKIPPGTLIRAAKGGGILGRRARLAETLSHMHHKVDHMAEHKKHVEHAKMHEEMAKHHKEMAKHYKTMKPDLEGEHKQLAEGKKLAIKTLI